MTLRKVWPIPVSVDCKAVGNNIFFFQFERRDDLVKVKSGGPRHFDQNLLALESFVGKLSPAEYKFSVLNIWMHIVDPPLMMMTLECATQIGNLVGTFIEWDRGVSKIVWGRRMRIRVAINLNQFLMRGTKVLLGEGEERWIEFKHEKLPFFCYFCGVIGHRYIDCSKRGVEDAEHDVEELPYPKSLLAAPIRGGPSKSTKSSEGGTPSTSPVREVEGPRSWVARVEKNIVKRCSVNNVPKFSESSTPSKEVDNNSNLNLFSKNDMIGVDGDKKTDSDEGGFIFGSFLI